MKRFICLTLALLFLLSGCAAAQLREPVTFYYPRTQYRYGAADGVIAQEQRESTGHRGDLTYLLSLYLMGPAEEGLRSPLPKGILLMSATVEAGEVRLTLSDSSRLMTEADFSLACACLALTAQEITGLTTVSIESGDRSVTMTAEDLTLYDDSATAATEETQ